MHSDTPLKDPAVRSNDDESPPQRYLSSQRPSDAMRLCPNITSAKWFQRVPTGTDSSRLARRPDVAVKVSVWPTVRRDGHSVRGDEHPRRPPQNPPPVAGSNSPT